MDIQEKDRHDIVLANPPFGGGERREVQQNFPIRRARPPISSCSISSASCGPAGAGAVVIKNTFLSNTDNASVAAAQGAAERVRAAHHPRLPRRHIPGRWRQDRGAVLREGREDAGHLVLPARSGPQHGQDQPAERRRSGGVRGAAAHPRRRARRAGSSTAPIWTRTTCDLSVKNPNAPEAEALRSPEEIIADMLARDAETADILENIRGML